MRKVFIIAAILLASNCFAKISNKDLVEVYDKLINANSIQHPPKLYILDTKEENAMAECFYNRITVFQGMMNKLNNKDEAARLLGHELGHFKTACRPGRHVELLADVRAKDYLERAGYNTCKAAKYLIRRNTPESISHPSDKDRVTKALKCNWRR